MLDIQSPAKSKFEQMLDRVCKTYIKEATGFDTIQEAYDHNENWYRNYENPIELTEDEDLKLDLEVQAQYEAREYEITLVQEYVYETLREYCGV